MNINKTNNSLDHSNKDSKKFLCDTFNSKIAKKLTEKNLNDFQKQKQVIKIKEKRVKSAIPIKKVRILFKLL